MKVLVADDHAMIREGISDTLKHICPDISIYEAENARSTLQILTQEKDFSFALIDLFMPDSNGFSLLRKLCNDNPDLPVIVFSASEDPQNITKSLDAGAVGYIPKNSSKAIMINAIQLVLAGGIYVPNAILKESKKNKSAPNNEINIEEFKNLISTLTRRQFDILKFVAIGKSNKQIAYDLNISENTVKTHVSAILKHLHLHNRTQVGILAAKAGINKLS